MEEANKVSVIVRQWSNQQIVNKTRIKPLEEPDFPVASLRAKVHPVWQVRRRRTEKGARPARKVTEPGAGRSLKATRKIKPWAKH